MNYYKFRPAYLIFFFHFLTSNLQSVHAQDSVYVKANAIPVVDSELLNQEVYQAIKGFQLLMIGELHGTNEPAHLVTALANLLLKNETGSILIGLEIPSDEMEEFLADRSEKGIRNSSFFKAISPDGRASVAWANVLIKFMNESRVDIFFYDITKNEAKLGNRDSIMFTKVKREMIEHPNSKTITLSGNVHNMLKPFRGQPKMGLYLESDKALSISKKTLSIRHEYGAGEMFNNMGYGLKINRSDDSNSIYARSVDHDCYFMSLPPEKAFNAVFFTRKVTSADLLNKN